MFENGKYIHRSRVDSDIEDQELITEQDFSSNQVEDIVILDYIDYSD